MRVGSGAAEYAARSAGTISAVRASRKYWGPDDDVDVCMYLEVRDEAASVVGKLSVGGLSKKCWTK